MDKKEEDKIELRSEDVQEILSRPPRSLVRWGTAIICGILVSFFIGSFFFAYPDVIDSEITITTENPPAWIVARSTGRLMEIYKEDRQEVKKGEGIAVLENPANTKDVLQVKSLINSHVLLTDSVVAGLSLPPDLCLGMVQSAYASLQKALNDYKSFLDLDLYKHKIIAVNLQLEGYDRYILHLKRQVALNKQSAEIAEKDYRREKKLFEKELSSELQLETSTNSLLSARQNTEQLQTTVSSVLLEKAKLNSSLEELLLQQKQELNQLRINLLTAWKSTQVAVGEWEQTYLLQSPADGILSYNEMWRENKQVNAGNKVFSVVSAVPGRIVGKVKIPSEGSGKVKRGQRVNVRVNGYPHMEYGYLTGTVENVSMLPDENCYFATVRMPQELRTSYGKPLDFKGELGGTVEIITDELSLAQRILHPVRYIFQRNFTR